MLPAPPGYLAVPGRIVPIPGTEYVVITPDWSLIRGQTQQAQAEDPQDANSNSVTQLNDQDMGEKQKQEIPPLPQPSTCNSNVNVAHEQNSSHTLSSLTKRPRGRPPKGTNSPPCQCPNCKIKPNSDRHLCHFTNCGRTFTKKQHLEAHIRKHLGSRPFVCPQQNCNASFTRYEELKRHYFVHGEEPRFQCQWCDKKFNRIDHYKGHMRHCATASSGGLVRELLRMEQEDDARAGQEEQGVEDINPLGDKQGNKVKEETQETEDRSEETDTSNINMNEPIIITDDDSDSDVIELNVSEGQRDKK